MELSVYVRFVVALVFVLGLIGLIAWVARRFGLGGARAPRGSGRRLTIVDSIAVDGKRRLVLVRRDDVEHLVLVGATGEHVVETGIVAPPPEPTDREGAK